MPRARCQIARHIVKYTTPRAVGNIMFSLPVLPLHPRPLSLLARLPRLAVPPSATRLSPPSTLANGALRFCPLLLTPARSSRSPRINSRARARCTAVVLTSERRQRALPEIHFSASHRRCSATTSDVRDTRTPVRAPPPPPRISIITPR